MRTIPFADCAEQWFLESTLSDTTKKLRRAYYARDIYPAFKEHFLEDITEADVRTLCETVKARGAPGTAVQILSLVRRVYAFAGFKGYGGGNPARFIANASIARFSARRRVLAPAEIALLYQLMRDSQFKPHYVLAIRLLLLTLARRGELLLARWEEVDFEAGVWTIPPGRAKATKVRQVYLSTQAMDCLIELKALAGESEYLFPSPLDSFMPMACACLDACTKAICRRARALNGVLQDFAPSDLRSTAEESLKVAGFDLEWIDVAMSREVVMRRHRIYDPDSYASPLRHMLQEWANMIDAWAAGGSYVPILVPADRKSS